MNTFRVWLRDRWLWLKAVSRWFFVEPWRLWIATGAVGIAFLISLQPGTTEQCIRITGMVLQLLGLGTVAWGVAATRALFKTDPLLVEARKWVNRFPRFRGRVVVASGHSMPVAFGAARGRGIESAPAGASLEEWVGFLDNNLRRVNERLEQTRDEMDNEFRKVNALLKQEAASRIAEDASIRRTLTISATGDIRYITLTGALWLFIGVLLSTVSHELARWLQ